MIFKKTHDLSYAGNKKPVQNKKIIRELKWLTQDLIIRIFITDAKLAACNNTSAG
jgi:hypothetical protein